MHRLADQIFPQHRTERGASIAAARKRSAPRALQLNVPPPAVAVDHFAQKQRPPVAKLWHEMAELVAGIGLGQRCRSLGCFIACQDFRACSGIEGSGIQPQFLRQFAVKLDQRRPRHRCGLPGNVEALQFTGKRIVEGESSGLRVVGNLHHDLHHSVALSGVVRSSNQAPPHSTG